MFGCDAALRANDPLASRPRLERKSLPNLRGTIRRRCDINHPHFGVFTTSFSLQLFVVKRLPFFDRICLMSNFLAQ